MTVTLNVGGPYGGVMDTESDVRTVEETLPLDAQFDIVANRRRRCLLRCIEAHDSPIALADLADEVAVREHESHLSDVPAEEVKRTYLSLYHKHVPKLAEANIVEYDQKRDSVSMSANDGRVRALLRLVEPQR
ncbi:DUF7344 domain-containing protein [Haladaptatus salinisoli]|uniref:DUF7344 domain-containing protein n=1 Tax=Haladaptatus salinisoli TaxID=2884876 RepID=UPI001D09F0C1|nr:hypothetical protein [Haladaptatus salinisoli]